MAIRAYPYYGGKYRMVGILSALIPECGGWYELFGGSCALTLNHHRCRHETVNEANADIFGLLKVMQDEEGSREFEERLWGLEYSPEAFSSAKRRLREDRGAMDEVERAVCTFTLVTQSYNNTGQSFSTRCAGDYRAANAYNAHAVHERLEGVDIQNRDALDILGEIKGQRDSFVFLDPPYLHRYRGKGADKAYGRHEMDEEGHRRLLETAKDAGCKIMICGYRSKEGGEELYDSILRGSRENEWRCYLLTDIHKPNKGGERAKEYIWVNYRLPEYAGHFIRTENVMA